MKSSQAVRYIKIALRQGQIPCLWGAPGIGKTQTVIQKIFGFSEFKHLIMIHAGIKEPVDFVGLPFASMCRTYAEFLPYGDLKTIYGAQEPTLVFLDDVGQSQHPVQAALMQLLEGGNLNGSKVSQNVRFILASNRTDDRAFVQKMLAPLEDRCKPHIDFEVDLGEWCKVMNERKRLPEVIAFNRWTNGDSLSEFGKMKDSKDHAYPTPRSWEKLAVFLTDPEIDRNDDCFEEIVGGFIGKKRAGEFCGFLQVWKELPTKPEVLANPMQAKLPTSGQGRWAVASWIAGVIDPSNSKEIIRYAERLPQEYAAVAITDAKERNPDVNEYPGVTQFHLNHKELMAA